MVSGFGGRASAVDLSTYPRPRPSLIPLFLLCYAELFSSSTMGQSVTKAAAATKKRFSPSKKQPRPTFFVEIFQVYACPDANIHKSGPAARTEAMHTALMAVAALKRFTWAKTKVSISEALGVERVCPKKIKNRITHLFENCLSNCRVDYALEARTVNVPNAPLRDISQA